MEKHLAVWATGALVLHLLCPLHLIETIVIDLSALCFLAYVSSDIVKDARAAKAARLKKRRQANRPKRR